MSLMSCFNDLKRECKLKNINYINREENWLLI